MRMKRVRILSVAMAGGLVLTAAGCYAWLGPVGAPRTDRIHNLAAAMAAAPPISLTDCETQTLALGATGDCVTSLQDSLAATGVNMSVDGQYGLQTQAAVQAFQKEQGLEVDGIAGPQTITRLDFIANSPQAISPPPPTSVQAAQPSGAQIGPGIYACGKITCTYYFSQSATKTIDQAISNPASVAGQGATVFKVCKQFGPEGEAYCTAGAIVGTFLLGDTVHRAAENDMCLAVKALVPSALDGYQIVVTKVYVNDSTNCIA